MYPDKKTRLGFTQQAQQIISGMSLEEKIALMSGNNSTAEVLEAWYQNRNYSYRPYTTPGNPARHVPPIRFSDGGRGAVCGYQQCTCFPATVCRGASFDRVLETQIGSAIAGELRVFDVNVFGGVCVNLPYYPGWGRSQEVYGEDSFAIGSMATALIEGVQGENVMACVKHFAFNSIETNRFQIDVECDERTEQEVFLSHFKDCIDAGAACVMGSYNKYLGRQTCGSTHLLRDILKGRWDFDGFVMSDWYSAIKDTVDSANAGLDLEMPAPRYYGQALLDAVKKGKVPVQAIDEAALRIVRTVLAFDQAAKESKKQYPRSLLGCKDHRMLALRSAQEGITLLKNQDQTLPFSKAAHRVALLGKLAVSDNLGDHGSSRVFPRHAVTPLEGISRLLPNAEIIYYDGEDIHHAKDVAAEADAVVLLAGCSYEEEGECSNQPRSSDPSRVIGGDRTNLCLHQHEIDLIHAVSCANGNMAVVLIGGGVLITEPWLNWVPAALMAFYPGQEGGTALAQILFGDVNPSGKLPFAVPVCQAHLPDIRWGASEQHYGYYHGYAKLDKDGHAAALPFGFGLSYTQFSLTDIRFSLEEDAVCAACTVKNTGSMAGAEVVQLYAGFENSRLDRPKKLLRGFERVSLKPGEEARVTIRCPLEKLKYYDVETKTFRLEPMEYQFYLGTSSADGDLTKGCLRL